MVWTKTQLLNHIGAVRILEKIKDEAFEFIKIRKDDVTEKDVQGFVHKKFKEYKLKTDHPQIIAFGVSSATPHYYPDSKSAKKLKKNTFILIDLWARLNKKRAPFADLTWVGFYGDKMPADLKKVFNVIIKSRDTCITYIKEELKKSKRPTGKEIDDISRKVIMNSDYGSCIKHSTGHSIGTTSPHGIYGHLRKTNYNCLLKNLGYTIEPGIYIKNKFGIRSEIDFYIDKNMKLILTCKIQRKMIRI